MMARFALCAALVSILLAAVQAAAQSTGARPNQPAKRKAPQRTIDPIGRPEGAIHDQTARFYVWHDNSGWHVRTTAKRIRQFHGTIRVKDARIKSCLPVGLKERQKRVADAFRVNAARDELQFTFKTASASDGFDLALEGDEGEIEFDLAIEGQKPLRAIFIGRGKQHPPANPFRFPSTPMKASPSS